MAFLEYKESPDWRANFAAIGEDWLVVVVAAAVDVGVDAGVDVDVVVESIVMKKLQHDEEQLEFGDGVN